MTGYDPYDAESLRPELNRAECLIRKLEADNERLCQQLAAVPAWHDKPTCPGWWVAAHKWAIRDRVASTKGYLFCITDEQIKRDKWAAAYGPWFGPIPGPTEEMQ